MVLSLSARAAFVFLLGWMVLVHAHIAAVGAAMIANACLRGLFEPVSYAAVVDLTPPEQRVAAFGLQHIGLNVGWVVGPMVGGLLTQALAYGDIFFCAAPPLLACAWALWRVQEPRCLPQQLLAPGPAPPSFWREVMSRSELALLLACAFIASLAQTQFFTTFSIYASGELHLAKHQIGLLYTINGLTVLLLQVPAVACISRLGNARALVTGACTYWLAFLCIGLAGDALELGGATLLLTLGELVLAPAEQAVAAQLAARQRIGSTLGAHGGARMLGVSFAPLLGGLALDHLNGRSRLLWAVVLGGLFGVLAIGYSVLGHKLRSGRSAK
jgi:MFS family permease